MARRVDHSPLFRGSLDRGRMGSVWPRPTRRIVPKAPHRAAASRVRRTLRWLATPFTLDRLLNCERDGRAAAGFTLARPAPPQQPPSASPSRGRGPSMSCAHRLLRRIFPRPWRLTRLPEEHRHNPSVGLSPQPWPSPLGLFQFCSLSCGDAVVWVPKLDSPWVVGQRGLFQRISPPPWKGV